MLAETRSSTKHLLLLEGVTMPQSLLLSIKSIQNKYYKFYNWSLSIKLNFYFFSDFAKPVLKLIKLLVHHLFFKTSWIHCLFVPKWQLLLQNFAKNPEIIINSLYFKIHMWLTHRVTPQTTSVMIYIASVVLGTQETLCIHN